MLRIKHYNGKEGLNMVCRFDQPVENCEAWTKDLGKWIKHWLYAWNFISEIWAAGFIVTKSTIHYEI